MRRGTFSIATVSILLIAGFGFSDVASIDPTVLSRLYSKYSEFSLEFVDSDVFLLDTKDGHVSFQVDGREYEIFVREYTIFRENSVPMIIDDEGGVSPDPTYSFRSRFFRGIVKGDVESSARFAVTAVGISGSITERGNSIHFEPLENMFHRDIVQSIPNGLHIIYRPENFRMRTPVDTLENEEFRGALPSDTQFQTLAALSPFALIEMDSQAYWFFSCWYCKVDSTMAWVDEIYGNRNFIWTIYVHSRSACTGTLCDNAQGMSSTNAVTLLDQWSLDQYQDLPKTWDSAHLFTGKNLDGSVVGTAYLSGRYGITQLISEDNYDGGSNDYESGVLVSHEMGHNFAGRHQPNADSYPHAHCGIFCDTFTHYTVMYSPFNHEPEIDNEMTGDFSSVNRNAMNACNDGTWAALSYYPARYDCA